jgi:hypothetical protein
MRSANSIGIIGWDSSNNLNPREMHSEIVADLIAARSLSSGASPEASPQKWTHLVLFNSMYKCNLLTPTT